MGKTYKPSLIELLNLIESLKDNWNDLWNKCGRN
jgi:hypothetical protein